MAEKTKFTDAAGREAWKDSSGKVYTEGGNRDTFYTVDTWNTRQTQKYGAAQGGNQLPSYLDDYQNKTFGAADNLELRESISAQLEPDMDKPELLNRTAEFEKLRGEYGVAEEEALLTDLKAQLEEQYATKRARTTDAEGKPVAMGVIAGRVGEVERQENERIDAIGRQINVTTDKLNTAYNVIQTYMNFQSLDYQDAVTEYNAQYNRNLQIYNLVDEEMDEQQASARANLQIYTNAITSGNMSYDQLSGDQKTMLKKLEVQSGLPIGFVSSLKMSPKDSILGTSSDGTQAWVIGEDGNMKVINTGLKSSKTGSGLTEREDMQLKSQDMTAMLRTKIGADGKVSPDTWSKAMRGWTAEGGTEDDFKNRFSSYINKSYDEWYRDYDGFSVKDSNSYYE